MRVSLLGQGFLVGGNSPGGPPAEEAGAASGTEHGLPNLQDRKARRGAWLLWVYGPVDVHKWKCWTACVLA